VSHLTGPPPKNLGRPLYPSGLFSKKKIKREKNMKKY
jgi:hypothetical protein